MAEEGQFSGIEGPSERARVDLSASDLRRALRDRQRARNHISCLPCRERKVRCNREHPCLTCIKRDHPDLCIYPTALQPTRPCHPRPTANASPAQSVHESPSSSSAIPLLGDSSLLAIAREHNSQTCDDDDDAGRGDVLENAVMPLLGVAGMASSSRPGPPAQSEDLYADLPDDRELLSLFSIYRDRTHPFQLILCDIDAFESQLCEIINQRAGKNGENEKSNGNGNGNRKSSNFIPHHEPGAPGRRRFLCLLHSILATGAQFSDLPVANRSAISRRHVRCAFRLLMAENYLLQPFHEGVTALVILAHVLQNDGNPQAAWILSGSTIRMAISLGIHAAASCPKLGPPPVPTETARKLRLAIVWQDALLSLAFNRPPASQDMDSLHDLPALSQPAGNSHEGLDYGQAMNWLCHLTLRHWQYALGQPEEMTIRRYTRLFDDLDALEGALQSHLRSRDSCHSIQAIQEFYSLEVNVNFTVSTFCRPILSKNGQQGLTKDQADLVLGRLQQSLKRSVKAFIRTRSVTGYASRSWAFVHNGLTSALLLSFMKETRNEDESRQIQDELIKSLAEGDDALASELSASSGGDCARQMTIAHRKSLKALKALRKISEEERERTSQLDRAKRTERASFPRRPEQSDTIAEASRISQPANLAFAGNAMGLYQDPGTAEFDELLRSFDFGSALPIEAFDYITFDPMAPTF